jgi:hypothetical protein
MTVIEFCHMLTFATTSKCVYIDAYVCMYVYRCVCVYVCEYL